ncbi:MAG: hypothetical protein IKJ58_02930 [Akkermansia sp.]|nr:hypothetical protein [Akkermansia sp.]
MMTKYGIRKALLGLLVLSATLLSSSCTRVSSYLEDMGNRFDRITVDTPTVYRSGGKMYVIGRREQCRELSYLTWSPKGPNTRIVKIDDTEGEIVYHEINKVRGNSGVSYELTRNSSWSTTPPATPLISTSARHDLHLSYKQENERTDLNALWAYPAATLAFLAIDIPCNVGTGCFMIGSLPVLFVQDLIKGR